MTPAMLVGTEASLRSNRHIRRRRSLGRFGLAVLTSSLMLLAITASSASALSIGVMWSGDSEQSVSASEWNVIKHSGSEVYRVMIYKKDWEEKGASHFDQIFQLAAERGVAVLPYLYDRGYPKAGEPSFGQWLEWAADLVSRYGYNGSFWQGQPYYQPVTAWEIGNEPNLPEANANYGGVVAPVRFAELVVAVSKVIKDQQAAQAAGAGTKVLSGGLYLGPVGSEALGYVEFLNVAYTVSGFAEAISGVSIHPYGFETSKSSANKTTAESIDEIEGVRQLLDTKTWGKSRTLWVTEIGWPVGGNEPSKIVAEADQARLLNESFNWIKANAAGHKIETLIWWSLRDLPNHPSWDYSCGLRDQAGHFRPSWFAFQAQTGAAQWPVAPAATTGAASEVLSTSANLNGVVDPNGADTTYQFEYGPTASYGHTVPVPAGSAGSGDAPVARSVPVTGLQPATTYHYRIVASSIGGDSYGADQTFRTDSEARAVSIVDPDRGITVAWRGNDGHLYQSVAVDGQWTTLSPTWGQLPSGVTVASDPALALDDNNGLVAVWRGSDNHIYETVALNGGWTTFEPTWENLPAGVTARGNPAVAYDPVNGITIEWRGSDGNLYETVAPGGGDWVTFSPTWKDLPSGVTVAGDPAMVMDADIGVRVQWRGSNGHLYETLSEEGDWTTFESTWEDLPTGVKVAGSPASVIDPANGVTVVWRGSDGNVYETVAPNGEWTTFSPTWEDLPPGVTLNGDPAVAHDPINGITILWRGSNDHLYETVASGSGDWTTFEPTWEELPSGVTVDGDPAVVHDPVSGITANWRGSDGNLYETHAPGSGDWVTFSPTSGRLDDLKAAGRPAVTLDASEDVKSAWRGSDGNIFTTFADDVWRSVGATAFQLPSGVTIVGDPAVIRDPTNGVVAVARGSDGHIYQSAVLNGQWTTFSPTWDNRPSGVTATGTPALAISPTNGLVITWRGSDGNIFATLAPGGGDWITFSPTWSNKPAGVTAVGSPSVTHHPNNGLMIAWRGSNGHLYETLAINGDWTTFEPTWQNLPSGVTVASDPATSYSPATGIALVWRGSNNHLYATLPYEGNWTTFEQTWQNLPSGVTVAGNPAAIPDPVNGLVSSWRGSNGHLYQTVAVNGTWTTFEPTWQNLPSGVTVASDPAMVITPNDGLAHYWRGSDGNVYETVAVSGNWTTFAPTWGSVFGTVRLAE